MEYEKVTGICQHKDSGEKQYLRKQERVEKGYDDKINQYGMGDRKPMEFTKGKASQYRK